MIIVSQNKTELINFSNIVRLAVSNNAEGQALIEVHNFCDDFETVIGLYKTEERAKEVLREIIEKIKNKSTVEMDAIGVKTEISDGIYEMPQE